MNDQVQKELLKKIKELEAHIEDALETGRKKFSYEMKHGKAVFSKEVQKLQVKERPPLFFYLIKIPFLTFVTTPVIYSMIFPALFLDLCVSIFQWVCFPAYKIEKVKRKEYITFDRHHLRYLNIIEKVGCVYCSYVNGLFGYVSEIAGRTERFFCPIKHAKRMKYSHRYYYDFLEYGDYKGYKKHVAVMKKAIESSAKSKK